MNEEKIYSYKKAKLIKYTVKTTMREKQFIELIIKERNNDIFTLTLTEINGITSSSELNKKIDKDYNEPLK